MPLIDLVASQPPSSMRARTREPNDWYSIENSTGDEATVLLYDEIGGYFGTEANDFYNDLKAITAPNISVRVNSPGGSVFTGITLSNILRAHPANVTVYIDGLAASIASVIMLAGDRTIVMPSAQIMCHNASGGCWGQSADMLKMVELLDKQSRNIAEAYSQKTGLPVDEWAQYMSDETWFSAQEAVDIGLADEIYTAPKKEAALAASLMNRAWDLSVFRYAGREAAPGPTAKASEPIVETPITEPQTITRIVDIQDQLGESFATQFKALVREALHDEITEIFDTVAPSHSTAVEAGTWDASANEKKLPSPLSLSLAKRMYTWWDGTKVEDGAIPHSAAKLPHHFVSADGTPGAASINGVRNALARLPQTQGLSDAERSAAEAHLRKHLNAFSGDEEDSTSTDLHAHAMPKFAIGSRVKITVPPHEEGQDTGVVAEINDGPAYGIRFDGGEHEGSDVHHWYVEDEVEAADSDSKPTPPAEEPAHDSWAGLFAHLITPPSSADDVLKRLREAS